MSVSLHALAASSARTTTQQLLRLSNSRAVCSACAALVSFKDGLVVGRASLTQFGAPHGLLEEEVRQAHVVLQYSGAFLSFHLRLTPCKH